MKAPSRISISVLLAMFLAAGLCYGQNTAEQIYIKAVEYAAEGKFKVAKEEFEKALKMDPLSRSAKEGLKFIEDVNEGKIQTDTAIHFFKGTAYVMKGQGFEAIAELNKMATAIKTGDKKTLKNIATTSMASKGAQASKDLLANVVVDAVTSIAEKIGDKIIVDMDNIQIQKKHGGSIQDTRMIKGIILDKERVHEGMPKQLKKAKIALVNAALEIKKTEVDARIQIQDRVYDGRSFYLPSIPCLNRSFSRFFLYSSVFKQLFYVEPVDTVGKNFPYEFFAGPLSHDLGALGLSGDLLPSDLFVVFGQFCLIADIRKPGTILQVQHKLIQGDFEKRCFVYTPIHNLDTHGFQSFLHDLF